MPPFSEKTKRKTKRTSQTTWETKRKTKRIHGTMTGGGAAMAVVWCNGEREGRGSDRFWLGLEANKTENETKNEPGLRRGLQGQG